MQKPYTKDQTTKTNIISLLAVASNSRTTFLRPFSLACNFDDLVFFSSSGLLLSNQRRKKQNNNKQRSLEKPEKPQWNKQKFWKQENRTAN